MTDAPDTNTGPHWIMTNRKIEYGREFYIGSHPICKILYDRRSRIWLKHLDGTDGPFETFSAAMKEMHRLLKAPLTEDV